MRLTGLVIPLLFVTTLTSGQGIITAMAGTGSQGFSGDGGQAASAQIYNPQSPAVDSFGAVYFADSLNYRIRKIAPDGVITTIAGNGTQGTAGDGGPALSAQMGWVYQVAIDPGAQHLCFGDYLAYKIRCITLSTGIIQGYGTGQPQSGGDGGNVANASFYFPMGAAFDGAGNFYLSDFAANNVRRVDAVTSIVTTLAGGGPALGDGGPATSASLSFPRGLQYSNGALYIADEGDSRVRRVDLTSGIITTVAGDGSPYTSGDGGPATLAGMTPVWVTADTSGNLFVVDTQEVRMVDPSGNISLIAGGPDTGYGFDDIPATQTVFSGVNGVAWDAIEHRLLISDGSNDRIRQIFFTPPTTTSLYVSPNPGVAGQAISLQATVSPATATGSVRFHNGYAVLGTAAVTNGAATFTWTPSAAGSYGLRAVYGGDPNDNLSESSTINFTVRATTTTALSSAPNPSNPGSPVTLMASVAPAAATGAVQFFNGATFLGSANLSGSQAQLAVSNLPSGTDLLTAVYAGDANYGGSTSAAIAQVVKASTTTNLMSGPNPSTFGAAVTLTATVAPASATGSVQFFNAGTSLGTAALAGGQAQLVLSSLPAGTDSLTATYGGDATNASSASAPTVQTVNKASSTTTLSASPASQSNRGQTVTFTAKVAPSAATGVVQFLDGSTLIGTATLSGGTAAFPTSSLAAGNHSIKASYGGDSNVNASQSSALSYKVKH